MRRFSLAAGLLATLVAFPAAVFAATLTQFTIASGPSPFVGCEADRGSSAGTRTENSEVEPWVAVNPADPDNIVGTWQQDRWSDGGARGNMVGVSRDGGQTWRQVPVPGIVRCFGGRYERASDPWVTFAADGSRVYQMSLLLDITTPPGFPGGFGPNAMSVSRSFDGGETWEMPTLLVEEEDALILHDKNSMTADPNDARFAYAVWDRLRVPAGAAINPENVFGLGFKGPAMFTRTTDGGHTWTTPRVIYDPAANNQTIGNQVVVLPAAMGGDLLNVFNEILNFRNSDGGSQFDFNLSVLRSTDRGATWSRKPVRAAKMQSMALFRPFGVVDPDDGAGVRTGDILPEVAVDPTSGAVYAVWQDARFSGFQIDEVAVAMSADGGRTWSAPVKANQTPTGIPIQNRQAFTPAVRVAADGTVGVTYYDFRHNTADGGATTPTDAFLVRFRLVNGEIPVDSTGKVQALDETRLTPASFDNRRSPVARGFFLGDYVGLGVDGVDFLPFFTISTAADPGDVVFTRVEPGGGRGVAAGGRPRR